MSGLASYGAEPRRKSFAGQCRYVSYPPTHPPTHPLPSCGLPDHSSKTFLPTHPPTHPLPTGMQTLAMFCREGALSTLTTLDWKGCQGRWVVGWVGREEENALQLLRKGLTHPPTHPPTHRPYPGTDPGLRGKTSRVLEAARGCGAPPLTHPPTHPPTHPYRHGPRPAGDQSGAGGRGGGGSLSEEPLPRRQWAVRRRHCVVGYVHPPTHPLTPPPTPLCTRTHSNHLSVLHLPTHPPTHPPTQTGGCFTRGAFPSLEKLTLSRNTGMGGEGVRYLSSFLREAGPTLKLKEIDLRWVELGKEGAGLLESMVVDGGGWVGGWVDGWMGGWVGGWLFLFSPLMTHPPTHPPTSIQTRLSRPANHLPFPRPLYPLVYGDT